MSWDIRGKMKKELGVSSIRVTHGHFKMNSNMLSG